jgi:hypothetical protein
MPTSCATVAALVCSAASPAKAIRGIRVNVDLDQTGTLDLSYTLNGTMQELLVPTVAPARRVDGLWQHTCFETFLGLKSRPNYYEFNFSPSGEWAAYEFHAYRDGGPITDEVFAPSISVKRLNDELILTARLRWDRLSLLKAEAALRLGLSAVIEAADSTLSYWALKHPSEKPDFHHADSFALELALPTKSA